MMKGICRFAGTSLGSVIAAMASVGCSSEDMYETFKPNLNSTFAGKNSVESNSEKSYMF